MITSQTRESIIALIIDLHHQKSYQFVTLCLAVNIADRFLYSVSQDPRKAKPNGVVLSCVALLIAAKVEQSVSPSFNRMIQLLSQD